MLFKNDFLTIAGARYRLLYRDKDTDIAFALNIDDKKAWPREFSWSAIKKLPKLNPKFLQAGNALLRDSGDNESEATNINVAAFQAGNLEGLEGPRQTAQNSLPIAPATGATGLEVGGASQELLPEQLQAEAKKAEGFAPSAQVLRTLKKGRVLSDAQVRIREQAAEMLGPLMLEEKSAPGIFEPKERCLMIKARAEEAGCTVTVLYKHLRQFWLGGQTAAALTPTES